MTSATARAQSGDVTVPATVIATTDADGINLLHADFANPEGIPLPAGLPPVTTIDLPASGTFAERLAQAEAGVFGRLQRGVLYHVRGTRLLLFEGGQGTYNPLAGPRVSEAPARFHGTRTASSAVGLKSGTSPGSFLLFLGATIGDGPTWDWVLQQPWVDVITTSVVSVVDGNFGSCPDAAYVRAFTQQGRPWFVQAGNQDMMQVAFAPSGIPEAYRVGGVDENGKTYLAHMREDDPSSLAATATRPYETGDLFYRLLASDDSLDARDWDGGTSYAAPATAGRAANLLRYARELLQSASGGVRGGKLAVAPAGVSLPAKGPLADGDLTREELERVLRHVAIPAEPASPGRYLIEGYGALNNDAVARAERVLAGLADEPSRPEEDAAHARVDPLSGALFPEQRCEPLS